jgi:ABC-type glycerol-3-phosphate transport system substrate-binding protein
MKQQGVNLYSAASVWVMQRWAPLLWAYGGQLVNEAGVPAFNTPQGVEATKLFQDLAPLGGLDILKDLNGTITQGAHYRITAQSTNANVRLKALPALKGLDGKQVAPMYHWGTTVTKASQHKAEAWEFLRWLNSSENKRTLTDATNLPPITYTSIRDYHNDPWMQTFAENFVYGRMYPSVPGWPAAESSIIATLHKNVLANRTSAIQEVLLNTELAAKSAMGLL